MLLPRIIPCLLLTKEGLVKTETFKNPNYIGDPINTVKIFNEKKADELIIMDIYATTQNYEPSFNLINKIAREARMPICYSGGIKKLEHAKRIFSYGIEKIGISSIIFDITIFLYSFFSPNFDYIYSLHNKLSKKLNLQKHSLQ